MVEYRFKSSLFSIEPGEDEDINPRVYGRELAIWLKAQLERKGYEVEPIIIEDWGRCLMCSRTPYMLWVACGSTPDYSNTQPGDPAPANEDVTWYCFPVAETSLLQRIFKRVDTSAGLVKLGTDLGEILSGNSEIKFVDS